MIFVPTRRVDVVNFGLERLAKPKILGALVVLENELGVHRIEVHRSNPLKNEMASSSADARRSTSSSVLYTLKLARVVP